MNFYEFISLAKLFSRVFGGNNNFTVTDAELDAASEALKNLSYNRTDWTPQQREIYKALVDFANECSKGNPHE